MARRELTLVPLGAVLAAVFAGPAPAVPPAEAIRDASRRFSAAMVAGRTDEIASLYTEEGVLLPPGRVVRGRAAIREFFSPRPGVTQLSHAMTAEELKLLGDVAIDVGTWSNSWRKGEGEPQSASERYLVVWRKEADGAWRIAWDVWHRPAPATPPAPKPETASAPAAAPLRDELAALRPFVGKTWKGAMNEEKKVYDVSRWEAALGGRAVRILHSVGDGNYGGETLVRWDPVAREVIYDYVTTAAFGTRGKMTFPSAARVECHETVTGNAGGVTEVKATMELLADGRMKVSSRMLKNGSWEESPARIYVEDAAARVVLP